MISLPHASPLAQSGTGSVLGSSLLLVVLLLVLFFGMAMLRKWVKKGDDEAPKLGFTLGDLRRMRDEGQITEEEFERARTQMIAATQRAAEQAAEAAKGKGVTSPHVTDIEELRQRARRHRAGPGDAAGEPTLPPQEPPPPSV